jgi:BlaI family transcriptional regulator, penicillinase repressor
MSQKLLTGLELKVMNLLWDIQKGHVKDLVDHWDETPIPAYNTVSTVVRILEEKGFVQHDSIGRSHVYFPAVSRVDYQRRFMKSALESVFAGSVTDMVSTLVGNESLSETELDEIRRMIDQHE